MKPFTCRLQRHGFTLVEVLVVLFIVFILFAIMLGKHTDVLENSRAQGLRQQGVQMYKAIISQWEEAPASSKPDWFFPGASNRFDSSTAYFRALVTNGVLRVDYSFFGSPGPDKIKTHDPAAFLPSNNAWNLCLEVIHEPASTPFLFSRNFLAGRTHMVASNETLSVDMLGEPKAEKRLDFDRNAAVVITKAGTGLVIHKKDFKEGLSADRINPTPYRGAFLKP